MAGEKMGKLALVWRGDRQQPWTLLFRRARAVAGPDGRLSCVQVHQIFVDEALLTRRHLLMCIADEGVISGRHQENH